LPVEVEVDVSPAGLPKTLLVGLPEAAVKESTHRAAAGDGQLGLPTPAEPRGHQHGTGLLASTKDAKSRSSRLLARS
jgi:hypothetical protein